MEDSVVTVTFDAIMKALGAEKNMDEDCISIFDIAKLNKEFYDSYYDIKRNYNEIFNNVLQNKSMSDIILYNFDPETEELEIGYNTIGYNYAKICLKKDENNKLFISQSDTANTTEVIKKLHNYLSRAYDDLAKFKGFLEEGVYIDSVNSKLQVSINNFGTSAYIDVSSNAMFNNRLKSENKKNSGNSDSEKKEATSREFELYKNNYDGSYSYHSCTSHEDYFDFLEGNEDDFFKNIYVRISDCPEWSQERLYKIRKKQLAKQNFVRKILPFNKK